MNTPTSLLQIDEHGYFHKADLRYEDQDFGFTLLKNLYFDERRALFTKDEHEDFRVEFFDQPFVVHKIQPKDSNPSSQIWSIEMPYGFQSQFDTQALRVDSWDRFLGYDINGIPFVLSPTAQDQFFDFLQEFDDDSITYKGQTFTLPAWLDNNSTVSQEDFWSQIYQEKETPGWDLGEPTPILKSVLPQLKLSKSRIAVLGCGSGHDAAHLAQQGHIVTGFDFSPEAIGRAQKQFGHIEHLNFVQTDIFEMNDKFFGQFDLVFEHTCYCAINPQRRNELVQLWRQLLADGGHLLGVFFAWDQPKGPPYGASEWELRERTHKYFHSLYWTRWNQSIGWRQGLELVIYAQKKELL